MRGWVSRFVLLAVAAALGVLGVIQLIAAVSGADVAPTDAIGALIVLVPAAIFAGYGLRGQAGDAVDGDEFGLDRDVQASAVIIAFPQSRRSIDPL